MIKTIWHYTENYGTLIYFGKLRYGTLCIYDEILCKTIVPYQKLWHYTLKSGTFDLEWRQLWCCTFLTLETMKL